MNIEYATKLELELLYKTNSIKEIADKYGTYPMRVSRLLKKFGIKTRDASFAQTQFLEKHIHPRLGLKQSEESKLKIAQKQNEKWKDNEEARQKLSERAKECWNNKTETEKKEQLSRIRKACRETIKTGSKLEKFIIEKLEKNNYDIEFHKKHMFAKTELEVDIYIPELTTVIEIDGPSHSTNVWGAEHLTKTQMQDATKNGLILSMGYYMVRITHIKKYITLTQMKDIWDQLIVILHRIQSRKLQIGERFIRIEAKS
jgi:very-short-patch-repair endonuclease